MTSLKSIFAANKIAAILILIFLAEYFSLACYFISVLEPFFFGLIIILALALSVKNLRLGIFILLTELFIGSKGYLFFFDFGEKTVSIRIALFGAVMAVWFFKKIIGLIKEKKITLNLPTFRENADLLIFFALIAMGFLNGLYNRNGAGNIFYDFNGWLYFLIALPLLDTLKKTDLKIIRNIFIASVAFIGLKTLIFLYIFSHFSAWDVYPYYRWLRDTGVGEITLMPNGFYRIFFQSQIFALAGIFIFLTSLLPKLNSITEKSASILLNLKLFIKENYLLLSTVCCLLSSVLISFSRSYFVGLAVGIALIIFLAVFSYDWKMFFKTLSALALIGAGSLIIVLLVAKFPFPRVTAKFSASSLADRATELSGEAGASSRWALLPPLWKEIKSSPIFGKGFGATVTYKSGDPRVLLTSPDGAYTTYAFEWGWLDIWLKIGLLGLLAYIILILRVSLQAFRSLKSPAKAYEKYKYQNAGIIIGLLLICAVSVFSPYMNHPLGIGYLILALVFTHLSQKDNKVQDEREQNLHIS
ncbi:MAG: O-antigen ligase family protein [Patescibacteria group bacterium]|jgi:O-antigen ligase